jgi:hypothetical protein
MDHERLLACLAELHVQPHLEVQLTGCAMVAT